MEARSSCHETLYFTGKARVGDLQSPMPKPVAHYFYRLEFNCNHRPNRLAHVSIESLHQQDKILQDAQEVHCPGCGWDDRIDCPEAVTRTEEREKNGNYSVLHTLDSREL
jgi:hypothetical protein